MTELQRWAIGLGVLGVVGAVGCDAGETTTAGTAGTAGTSGTAGTGGTGGAGGTGGTGGGLVCPEEPSLGPVAEGCGIWVSVGQGNDANEGTQAAPVATLMHAIDLAAQSSGRVYACSETWTESLIVPNSVSLHGGFDCDNGWAYVGKAKRSIVTAPGTIGITWINDGTPIPTILSDFSVESADAVEPGGTSMGGFVRDDMVITIWRSELIAGNGADGLDGAPGDANGQPAAAGAPGNDGAGACSAALSPGGAAVENACSAGTSKGGAGGDSGPLLAESGDPGEPVSDPPGGAGGLGEQLAPVCTAGSSGLGGEEGAPGRGGGWDEPYERGRLTEEGYISVPGKDGEPGKLGQGGGGGGATFGSAAVCGAAKPGGAAGGSGGSGGGGGKGGGGGQGGGASFAIATRTSGNNLTLTDIVLWAGNGGNGGNGGPPQLGGSGGLSGGGGIGAGSIAPGCIGGTGGTGGRGGWGGGGRGGTSSPLVFLKTANLPNVTMQEKHYGEGGLGGKGDPTKPNQYVNGDDGSISPLLDLDP